jgi:hypothetical protein
MSKITIRQTEGKETWELVYHRGIEERVLLRDLPELKACDLGSCIARVYHQGRKDAKAEIRKALFE